ncbi:MBL fold metallo-hydrolase [Parerythrobacter jejuensis]|uniref:MBL fold metallo-hydrolase n=1 Tax=Parerythrobacter jejuensis TaxID=795812 RepID=A0A845AU92_9SPHN|nr:MBL fold metallo-hydrolase [Parerythrobacter jejuensis]MXP32381.1 MBL fold metallo-hydrolase [Parerythrobacter jejuensis]
MKVIMLGTGTSTGVPRLNGDWGDCDPNEPRNRRSRVSVVIESKAGQRVLVDTSTDLRAQFLANGITSVDGVFWTHDHADHCHGIDDLRSLRYGRGGPIAGFASDETVRKLRQRFSYVFAGEYGYPTIVELSNLDRLRMHAGFGVEWLQMPHGPTESTAFVFDCDGKTIGYATDFSEVTDDMLELFTGLDVLVCDCLRREPHPTHAHLGMALDLKKDARIKTMVLSHLDKSMDYRSLCDEVPQDVIVGYDGLEVAA